MHSVGFRSPSFIDGPSLADIFIINIVSPFDMVGYMIAYTYIKPWLDMEKCKILMTNLMSQYF